MKKAPREEPKTDIVYVYQAPPNEWCPSVSPDGMKIENLATNDGNSVRTRRRRNVDRGAD